MESHGLVGEYHCKRCKTTKAITEFYKDSRSKKGHHSYCKPCKLALRYLEYKPASREDTRDFHGRVLDPKQLKVRPCLKCDKPTETDFRNRLCPTCAYHIFREGLEQDVVATVHMPYRSSRTPHE